MEPTEAQYLILNALETLELLQFRLYDESTGDCLIITPSRILSVASLKPNGDIVLREWISEL